MTRLSVRPALLALVLQASTGFADAQSLPATSFEQLQVLVRSGATIALTDHEGRKVTGVVASLSPSSLELDVSGTRRQFEERDVATIRQRRGDSLMNGALIGLAAGAAASIYPALYCECTGSEVAAGIAAYAAIGAGIGVGIDAVIRGNKTIFRGAGTARRLTVSPLLTPTRRAVAVGFSF
jgi:hypothetical protein